MKVLVGTHSYSGNGAAIVLLSVMKHWVQERKWVVDVLLEMDKEIPAPLLEVGVNIFPTADPADYDFALVNTVVSARYLEMFAPKAFTVLWVHEGDTVLWSSELLPAQWRYLFSLPHRIVFQTPWQVDHVFGPFLKDVAAEDVRCVRNGMPALPSGLTPRPRRDDRKRIVFVGGVSGRKRPQDLVDAVLALDRKDVECVLIGSIEGLDTIGDDHVRKVKARPDLFELTGEVDRRTTLEYVMGSDVFCLPSGDESQPIAPVEAAALGVPCELSGLATYSGTWQHGENCLMHPVANVSVLRWNLQALLDDAGLRDSLSKAAAAVAHRFSIELFHRRFDAEMPGAR
jgi:glycosyltransferase involved in cell wall biosynthesis